MSSQWSRHYDNNYQCYYYVNNHTNTSQWEIPDEYVEFENEHNDNNHSSADPKKMPNHMLKKAPLKTQSVMDMKSYISEDQIHNFKTRRKSTGHYDSNYKSNYSTNDLHSNELKNESNRKAKNNTIPFDHSTNYSDMDNDNDEVNQMKYELSNITLYETYNREYEILRRTISNQRDLKSLQSKSKSYHSKSDAFTSSYDHDDYPKQDYNDFVRLYKIQRPYMSVSHMLPCVLCHNEVSNIVFFPCEHRCVCRPCLLRENIQEENLQTSPDQYSHNNCPLCGEIIKKYLNFENGLEIEKYWKWVFETKPFLSKNFIRNFRLSEGVIETVYVQPKFQKHKKRNELDSGICSLS
jgi:hypothetical protein